MTAGGSHHNGPDTPGGRTNRKETLVTVTIETRPDTGHDDPSAAISGITGVTHLTTKADMARWTRDHADAPGINWRTDPGPGGTLIVTGYQAGWAVPGRRTAGTGAAA